MANLFKLSKKLAPLNIQNDIIHNIIQSNDNAPVPISIPINENVPSSENNEITKTFYPRPNSTITTANIANVDSHVITFTLCISGLVLFFLLKNLFKSESTNKRKVVQDKSAETKMHAPRAHKSHNLTINAVNDVDATQEELIMDLKNVPKGYQVIITLKKQHEQIEQAVDEQTFVAKAPSARARAIGFNQILNDI